MRSGSEVVPIFPVRQVWVTWIGGVARLVRAARTVRQAQSTSSNRPTTRVDHLWRVGTDLEQLQVGELPDPFGHVLGAHRAPSTHDHRNDGDAVLERCGDLVDHPIVRGGRPGFSVRTDDSHDDLSSPNAVRDDLPEVRSDWDRPGGPEDRCLAQPVGYGLVNSGGQAAVLDPVRDEDLQRLGRRTGDLLPIDQGQHPTHGGQSFPTEHQDHML